jgi:hypothetical protein
MQLLLNLTATLERCVISSLSRPTPPKPTGFSGALKSTERMDDSWSGKSAIRDLNNSQMRGVAALRRQIWLKSNMKMMRLASAISSKLMQLSGFLALLNLLRVSDDLRLISFR